MDNFINVDLKTAYVNKFYDEVHLFLQEALQDKSLPTDTEKFNMWLQAAVMNILDYDSMLKSAIRTHLDIEDNDAVAQTIIDQFSRRDPDAAYATLMNAYDSYKKNWIKENVPAAIVKKTKAMWKESIEDELVNDDEDADSAQTFEDYLDENGYANGYGLYEDFFAFVVNHYCF